MTCQVASFVLACRSLRCERVTPIGAILLALAALCHQAHADGRNTDRIALARENREEYLAQLRILAAAVRANFERLVTWQGSFELRDHAIQAHMPVVVDDASPGRVESLRDDAKQQPTLPQRLWMERAIVVRFAIDLKGDRLFSTFESRGATEYEDPDTGAPIASLPLRINRSAILDATSWIQAEAVRGDATVPEKEDRRRVAQAVWRRREEAKRHGVYSSLIDPRRLYRDGEVYYFDILEGVADALSDGAPAPVEVRRMADGTYSVVIEYRFGGPESDENPTIVSMVLDPSVACNVVALTELAPDGLLRRELSIAYTENDGIYVPVNWRVRKFSPGSDELEIERVFAAIDVHVNVALDADSFGWDKLGLVDGDLVRDEIRNVDLRYQNGKVVDAANYLAEAPTRKDGGDDVLWWFVFVSSNVAVVSVIILLIVRKWRSEGRR